MDENHEAPRSEGGNAKYAVIGLLLLLGGGGGIWMMTRPPPPPPTRPPPVVDAGPPPPTSPMVAAPIELPPEEPDAGPPVPTDAGPPRIRYVTRYVDACPGQLTDPAGVTRTAQANYGALRACYERELRVNPQLRGPLTAELKVGTSGRIEDVRVATAMNSRALVECVKASLRRLTVPPSRGGCAIAQVRFNFAPRE